MVTYTDNHGYQLYTDTEEPWQHRTDFSALDTEVEIRDVAAALSTYTPKLGALYRATDTGEVYLGNGDAWVKVDLDVNQVSANSMETTTLSGALTNGNTLSTIPYSDGDLVLIDSASASNPPNSTTNTTWTNAYTSVNEMPIVDISRAVELDFSNYYVRFTGRIDNSSATGTDTVHHRISGPTPLFATGDMELTEISAAASDGFPMRSSDWVPITPGSYTSPINFSTEMRVSGGTGNVRVTRVQIAGEI